MKKLTLVLFVTLIATACSKKEESVVPVATTVKPKVVEPVKIGDIYSFTLVPELYLHHKQFRDIAVEEINAAGGVLGRPIKVIGRDDQGEPGAAIRAAEDLVLREKVEFLSGTLISHVTLAVSEYADRNKILFMNAWATSPTISYEQGRPFTFSMAVNTNAETAIVASEVAKGKAQRWSTVAFNLDDGKAAVKY
ncbi:MAG: ABC transporter substrate-binding protein, partial [Gammaproteobacteria bacterium]|nr:ABC transporter substrate-binding protein [Gammaproteobacteria bacterium]